MRCLGGSPEEGEDSVVDEVEEGSVGEAAAVEEEEAVAAVEVDAAAEDTMALLLVVHLVEGKGLDLMVPHQVGTGQATDRTSCTCIKRGDRPLYLTKCFENRASLFTNIQCYEAMSYSSPPRSLKTR